MKRFIISTIVALSSIIMFAQDPDSLRIQNLESAVVELTNQNNSLRRELSDIKAVLQAVKSSVSILEQQSSVNSANIDKVSEELRVKIEATDIFAKEQSEILTTKTNNVSKKLGGIQWAGITSIILLLLAIFMTFLFAKKRFAVGDKSIEKIASAQKTLQEESIKLDAQLVEILEKQEKTQGTSNNGEPDHKLAISIANEVVRIEQNIAHMDKSVKGVSNLKNRADAIKTSLSSKGYEIPTLLGTVYHEGYNMVATMELDEDLEPGTQIIRRVTKPQINYNGKMIQAAQVVVAFNE